MAQRDSGAAHRLTGGSLAAPDAKAARSTCSPTMDRATRSAGSLRSQHRLLYRISPPSASFTLLAVACVSVPTAQVSPVT
jgi:hypothetical protein